MDLDYYNYLRYGGNHKVDGTNDARDFQDTLKGETRYSFITCGFNSNTYRP